MGSSWTGGRRRTKKVVNKKIKTLVVTNPLLFAKRDKKGDLPEECEWSESMVRQASEAWPKVLVFFPVGNFPTSGSGSKNLGNFLKAFSFSNVEVVEYTNRDPEEATKIWKNCILDLGGRYRPARNPREVAYLNMEKHFDAPHLTWVGCSDHKKAKVEIDKPKTFNDIQKIRKKTAQW